MKKIYLIFFVFLISTWFLISYAQSTTFAVIGDMGTDDQHETDVAALVASWQPDFVIALGDNIYPDKAPTYSLAVGKYFHQFMYPHEPSYGGSDTTTSNHFWPIVGNHDWDFNHLTNYLAYFELPYNERYYTKQIGDIEFFVLDSDQSEPDGTDISSIQASYMIPKIQNSTARWKIVLYHHPTYSANTLGDNFDTYITWPFENWGVDAVMCGHVHNYQRILIDDTNDGKYLVYFVDGAGGQGLDNIGTNITPAFAFNKNWGAMKVIEKDDSLRFEFHTVATGFYQTSDSYTINKPSTPNPVELTTFAARLVQPSSVQLDWNTATEVNNYGFDIQRSAGGNVWEKIGFVHGNGNSNSPKNYSFIDNSLVPGLYKYRLKQIDNDGQFKYSEVIKISIGMSDGIKLYQNYPNPFNPTTKIQFSLASASIVNLKIYNILGEEVKTLINNVEKDPGEYSIDFDGADLSGGVYMYVLRTGNFVKTMKMILLK